MKHKRIIAFVLSLIVVFTVFISDTQKVKASSAVISTAVGIIASGVLTNMGLTPTYYDSYMNGDWHDLRVFASKNYGTLGYLASSCWQFDLYNYFKGYFVNKGTLNNDATEAETLEETQTFIKNNYQFNNNGDVEFTNDFKQFMIDAANYDMTQYGEYYAYTCDISKNVSGFTDQNKYNALKDFCEQYQSDNYIVNLNSLDYLVKMPKSEWNFVGGRTIDQYTLGYNVSLYNNNWQKPRFCDLPSGYIYQYNNGSYTQGSFYSATQAETWLIAKNDGICLMSNSWGGVRGAGVYTYHKVETVKVYQTLNDLKATSVGESPYYITSNWQDFTNSGNNTTYTIDSSNYNPVTYGDIVAYNQQYYDDHSYYPTTSTTQEWIDNIENHPMPTPTPTPTPNPEDPNGNGGGSVSGNGSGSSGNIFDWISDLGSVLGNLIKNIGNLIVSLIDSLVSVITTITEKIPNLFGDLLNFVFGGLPEEIRALIILGITCMVIYGIIKLIRG